MSQISDATTKATTDIDGATKSFATAKTAADLANLKNTLADVDRQIVAIKAMPDSTTTDDRALAAVVQKTDDLQNKLDNFHPAA
jgi:hypothetical protein